MNEALNIIKDAYLKAIDWIEHNPQKTFWLGVAALVAVLGAAS